MIEMWIDAKIQSWGRGIAFADGAVLASMGRRVFDRIHDRVVNRGVDDSGKPFAAYSKTWPPGGLVLPVRVSGRWGRIRGGTRVGNGRWRKFDSYWHFRKAQGLPVDRKRFSLTGGMWEQRYVHVRLYWGYPMVVLRFKGNVSDAHTQDYSLQMRAANRHRRKGRGYTHFRTHRPKTRATRGPKVARAVMKAAMQWKEIRQGRSWFAIAQAELEEARDIHLVHLSEELRNKVTTTVLSGRGGQTSIATSKANIGLGQFRQAA